MMGPRAVVYDIGNVLIGWNPEGYYDSRIGPDRRRRLFAEVPIEAANLAVDAGGGLRDTMYALAGAHPAWASEIRWWHDHWADMVQPVIPHSVALMRRLRQRGVPVFALSNFGHDTFAVARKRFDFLNEFDRCYISGHLRVTKPDPEIYRLVEADCGFAPQELIFVDDRSENIAAALARGWHGHLFEGPQGWADRLVAEGLLTMAEAQAT